jgi:integrase
MATSKSSAGTIREHRSADGRRSFTATVRARGHRSTTQTFATRKEAQAWAGETLEQLRKQRSGMHAVRADATRLTVSDLILEYLASPEARALRSYANTEQMLTWFLQQCGGAKVRELNMLTLRAARTELEKGRAAGTVRRYFVALRSCWSWGQSAGLVPEDRLWPKRLMPPEPKGRTRFLSDEEIDTLLARAREYSPLMHAAILVSIATGMRRGELFAMKWADVDFARQLISVPRSKTDRPRAVHMTRAAVEALKALQGGKVRSVQGFVFVGPSGGPLPGNTLEYRWRMVRAAAGLKDFRWHDMRHTCASIMAQNGASLLELAEQLGHRSLAMVQRYSHLIAGRETPAHRALDAKLS